MNQVNRNRMSVESLLDLLLTGVAVSGLCLAIAGCSGGPARLDAPDYNPSGSGAKAMELYDLDGDGLIAGEELDKAPGIKAAMVTTDANKDGKVSEQEIADRIAGWLQSKVGLIQINCQVTLDGETVEGATVTFIPDPIFDGAIQEAEDMTSLVGLAAPRIPVEKRPSTDSPPGIQLGYYTVKISKKVGDKELIPANYNANSILGQEVARDDPAINNNRMRFNLKSK